MSLSNSTLNTTLERYRNIELEPLYRDHPPTETPTIELEGTKYTYDLERNLVFCRLCFVNISGPTLRKHLRLKHRQSYRVLDRETLEKIEAIEQRLGPLTLDALTNTLDDLTYYFRELPINFRGYKCRDYRYLSIARKQIRAHFNSKHVRLDVQNKSRVEYILEAIPIQTIYLGVRNTKYLFIPRLPRPIETSEGFETSRVLVEDRSKTLPIRPLLPERQKIIDDYRQDLSDRRNEEKIISTDLGSTLLTRFFTNSNILDFFKGRNKQLLVDLIASPLSGTIRIAGIENSSGINRLDRIEDLISELGFDLSPKIASLPRRLRQLLRTESLEAKKQSKDFRSLESRGTKRTYFRLFARLFTYIYRVYYIKRTYRDVADPDQTELYSQVGPITTHRELESLLEAILEAKVVRLVDPTESD